MTPLRRPRFVWPISNWVGGHCFFFLSISSGEHLNASEPDLVFPRWRVDWFCAKL